MSDLTTLSDDQISNLGNDFETDLLIVKHVMNWPVVEDSDSSNVGDAAVFASIDDLGHEKLISKVHNPPNRNDGVFRPSGTWSGFGDLYDFLASKGVSIRVSNTNGHTAVVENSGTSAEASADSASLALSQAALLLAKRNGI